MVSKKLLTPLTLKGKVITGEKAGRTIGFPTANLDEVPSEKELRPGVYFGNCTVTGKTYFCLPYFGPRYVFGEVQNVFEVYIYDFHQEIYGQNLEVTLFYFLRSPKKVLNMEQLQALLEEDKKIGLELQQSTIESH